MKPDEGYNSDSSVEIVKSTIEKDAAVFRANYFVEKLMHNSANGLIYTGKTRVHYTVVLLLDRIFENNWKTSLYKTDLKGHSPRVLAKWWQDATTGVSFTYESSWLRTWIGCAHLRLVWACHQVEIGIVTIFLISFQFCPYHGISIRFHRHVRI